jgi:RsiW-degrading membrane proteinase PrsW (M82 family)
MNHLSLSDTNALVLIRRNSIFMLVFAAIAGIFEELCKPLGLLIIRKQVSRHNAAALGWMVGAGAGLCESIIFVMQTLASPGAGCKRRLK